MRNLLASGERGVLRDLARPGTLVVLDFDGTLTRIGPDRSASRLSGATRRVLGRLAAEFPVAILTGRSAADVSARLDGLAIRWVVGSHGAEWPGRPAPMAWRRLVAGWRRTLARRLADDPGIDLEDKGLSLSLHWRNATNSRRSGAAALRAAMELTGAALTPGKRVLNVVPAGAGDKGTALRRLVAEAAAARVLFIGDDVTDEAAFRVRWRGGVMVRVGRSERSAAGFFVPRRADVDRVFARLLSARRALQVAEPVATTHARKAT